MASSEGKHLTRSVIVFVSLLAICGFGYFNHQNQEKDFSIAHTENPLRDILQTNENNCTQISECEDKCACAQENSKSKESNCRNDTGFIDYILFHYCTLSNLPVLSITLMILWLVFLLYMLYSTTEDFFIPALGKISDRFSLSGNVAGVTLLAFGNGSPGN